jgi:hypothetical protein
MQGSLMAESKHIPLKFPAIAPGDAPPSRPTSLQLQAEGKPPAAALIGVLLTGGKTVVVGGTSLIDPSDRLVPIISIVQLHDGMLRGWGLPIGHPHQELGFYYIDVAKGMAPFFFPDHAVDFVGTADARLTLPDATYEELIEMARYVFPFVGATAADPAI